MSRERVIVSVDASVSVPHALRAVAVVVEEGRISNDGKDYCYAVRFKDGTMVSTRRNKASDTFHVWED
jgi:hypothetical protein